MKRKHPGVGLVIATLLAPFLAFAGPVDINTADAATIAAELDGIGLARAEAIVAYRQANGPFRSVDDLLAVRGVGERILEANRDRIRLAKSDAAEEEGG